MTPSRSWDFERCRRLGISILERGDAGFPEILREVAGAPACLSVRGVLGARVPALAVVGSRRPTLYGKRMARRIAGDCAAAGVVVVSGLARGIDTAAHEAALEAGGITWAVLGSGLDRMYPPENRQLAERIVAGGGAVISEYGLDEPPLARNFPPRNRIISGLSIGTVVVEGGVKSGSLITARTAAEQGREVFAVPGPADSPMSEGPNLLLEQGARMTRGFADILAEFPDLAIMVTPARCGGFRGEQLSVVNKVTPARCGDGSCLGGGSYKGKGLTPEQTKILELLGPTAVSLEELISETGFGLSTVVRILNDMECRGVVKPLPGQQYARS